MAGSLIAVQPAVQTHESMAPGLSDWVRSFFEPPPLEEGRRGDFVDASAMVVLPGASRRTAVAAQRAGYPHVQRYLVLPSTSSPRWLLPLHPGVSLHKGFSTYAPYSRRARWLKTLVTTGGALPLALTRGVTVASRRPMPLVQMVRETTGIAEPIFAAAAGTPGPAQKLTVQVMTEGGDVAGYIKLPTSLAASDRIRAEVVALERLASGGRLRHQVPRVIHAGNGTGGQLLFQTAMAGVPGPVQLGPPHSAFLAALSALNRSVRGGPEVVDAVGAAWTRSRAHLSREWRDLGTACLANASCLLDGESIPCGFAHGDFAPWNTRLADGRLYVFDWEFAVDDVPVIWDEFHFRWQASTLLGQDRWWWTEQPKERVALALLVLFLLDHARRSLVDEQRSIDSCAAHHEALRHLLARRT